jgi:hypothetical protein
MKHDAGWIVAAIRRLDGEDSRERARVRAELEQLGPRATWHLVQAVHPTGQRARHEALKALVHLADPAAMELFVETLGDEDSECRWLAAEGLAALGEPGLRRTLELVIELPGTDRLLRSVHHALSAFQRTSFEPLVTPVLHAFQGVARGAELPSTAHAALTALRNVSHAHPTPYTAR